MNVAVVTIVRGRQEHLARQRRWLARCWPSATRHVVVVMGGADPAAVLATSGPRVQRIDLDVGEDEPLPLATARNRGAATAMALAAEVVVFLDVDVLPLPGLVDGFATQACRWPDEVHLGTVRYLGPDQQPTSAAVWRDARPDPRGEVDSPRPEPRPELFWSLSFALTPTLWDEIGGFDEGYVGYGAEDTDFGMRVAAAGGGLRRCPDARGLHQWHPTADSPERHRDLVRNARRFREQWGWWPMTDWLADLDARGVVRFEPDADVLSFTGEGS